MITTIAKTNNSRDPNRNNIERQMKYRRIIRSEELTTDEELKVNLVSILRKIQDVS